MRTLGFVFACALLLPVHEAVSQADETVAVVYEDVNRNETFDAGDQPLEDVLVSSLSEIRSTNAEGAATVPVEGRDIVFVIKPAGYALPLQDHRVPDFYYLHYPNGTPADLKYPGVAPTGPLPDTLFFPMHPANHGKAITANVVGDPQIPRKKENQIFRLETVPELMETDADFGLFLGDIADDNLDIFGPFEKSIRPLDMPLYMTYGNHDVNFRAPDNSLRAETYRRHFGPDYYSFNYGQSHFVVLNAVDYDGWDDEADERGSYFGGIDETQMEWFRQDIQHVDPGVHIYIVTHIPLHDRFFATEDGKQILDVVDDRDRVTHLSGHLHGFMSWTYDGDMFGTPMDARGYSLGATAGSWWAGPFEEDSVSAATNTDGTPNGFFEFTFADTTHRWRFVPVGKPRDHQLRISTPHHTVPRDSLGHSPVVVNVFTGDERCEVVARFDDRAEADTLTQFTGYDPFVLRTNHRRVNRDDWRPDPAKTGHLWKTTLPRDLSPGTHVIRATATCLENKEYGERKVFEVVNE